MRLVTTSLCAWLAAIVLASSTTRAEQFVLFDVTFTYTKEDAENSKPSKSHYYVKGDLINPDRPKDWMHPVDYRNGTVHIRTEVIEKPAGGEPSRPDDFAPPSSRGSSWPTCARVELIWCPQLTTVGNPETTRLDAFATTCCRGSLDSLRLRFKNPQGFSKPLIDIVLDGG